MKKRKKSFLYDGKQYDAHFGPYTHDVPFYLRQIRKYGEPVLELACGTGRITIPLAEKGIKITGLDISKSMLSQAKKNSKEKGVDVEWVKADCRDFRLKKKFNLIFFPINSICHLMDIESVESCFRCVDAFPNT
jgi:ubiquinone/menaquinone biosynthesis C-methylase UbiE